jgi:hypothetical protein
VAPASGGGSRSSLGCRLFSFFLYLINRGGHLDRLG